MPRKNDMQKIICDILVESRRQNIPYLSHQDIVDKVKIVKPKMKNLSGKVSQGLYLLQSKKRKWSEPKVIKVEKNGKLLGYSVDPLSMNLWK